MIKLKLKRYKLNEKGCFGELVLYDNDRLVYKCNTLEEINEGLQAKSDLRIPANTYKCDIHFSPSKTNAINNNNYPTNALIRIYNDKVSKFRYILIHIGNFLKDTLGCILLGVVDKAYTGVYNSKDTCKEFYNAFFTLCKKYNKEIKQDNYICDIEIINEF